MSYFLSRVPVGDALVEVRTQSANVSGTMTANQITINSMTSTGFNDGYDVFLLAGQSNMRGSSETATTLDDWTSAEILQWGSVSNADAVNISVVDTPILAKNPLNHVQAWNLPGSSIGMTFARLYQKHSGRSVMLVPSAYGGTGFSSSGNVVLTTGQTCTKHWLVNFEGFPYNLTACAIERANKAMAYHPIRNPTANLALGPDPANRFRAVLWHQGENDTGGDANPSNNEDQYRANLKALVRRFRSNIFGASNSTPFICGMLNSRYQSSSVSGPQMVLPQVGNLAYFGEPNCYVANTLSPTVLTSIADNIHFDNPSLQELGRRYFVQYANAVPLGL